MAIAYTGAGGLFTHLGAFVARIESYGPLAATDLTADAAAIAAALGSAWSPAEGVAAYMSGLRDQVSGWRQALAGYCDRRLADYDTVLSQLTPPLPSGTAAQTAAAALARQMLLDGKAVEPCVCTAGAVSAANGNAGSGNAYPTLTLDGFNAPVSGGPALTWYAGRTSELCVPSETMTLTCTADGPSDGLDAGDEVWSWAGAPAPANGPFDWRPEGSGDGPTLRTDNGRGNLVPGGRLRNWTDNVPTGWTVGSGTAGTHVLRDATAEGAFWAGTSGAKLVGDGSTEIELGVYVPLRSLAPLRRYHASVALKAQGATAGTVRLRVGDQSVAVAATALAGGYATLRLHLTTPAAPPSGGLRFAVDVTGLPGGGRVWLAAPALAPVTYHGGVGVNVVAGQSSWLRGDRLSFTVTNDQGGLFQGFFRRRYALQLPSSSGGAAVAGPALALPYLLAGASAPSVVSDALVT